MSDLSMSDAGRAGARRTAGGWRSAVRLLPEFPHDLAPPAVGDPLPGPWVIAQQADDCGWTMLRVVRWAAPAEAGPVDAVLEYHREGLFSFETGDDAAGERTLARACELVDTLDAAMGREVLS